MLPVDKDTYPFRVFGSGTYSGLFVLLRLYKDNLEYICRGPVQGFKLHLHSPGEVPQVSRSYIRIPLLEEVLVAVKPNVINTMDSLRDHKSENRQCYFADENFLQYFRVYTQSNCELELLANYTLEMCGCVKFSMPSKRFLGFF